jgi:nitrite reductase/ring-hydroxylating ferredoxin subunit
MAPALRVCSVTDVAEGELKGFAIDGIDLPILVANIAGTFFATSSMCPHEDVSLLDGEVEGPFIVCPGHGYRFDAATGECDHDRELCLRHFPVRVVDDAVYIELF